MTKYKNVMELNTSIHRKLDSFFIKISIWVAYQLRPITIDNITSRMGNLLESHLNENNSLH